VSKPLWSSSQWREAAKACGALHGICIYDDCCCLNIQYASPSAIVVAPTPPIKAPTTVTVTDQSLLLMATTPAAVLGRDQIMAADALQVEDNLAVVTLPGVRRLAWVSQRHADVCIHVRNNSECIAEFFCAQW
jgi:hypothetical protein